MTLFLWFPYYHTSHTHGGRKKNSPILWGSRPALFCYRPFVRFKLKARYFLHLSAKLFRSSPLHLTSPAARRQISNAKYVRWRRTTAAGPKQQRKDVREWRSFLLLQRLLDWRQGCAIQSVWMYWMIDGYYNLTVANQWARTANLRTPLLFAQIKTLSIFCELSIICAVIRRLLLVIDGQVSC